MALSVLRKPFERYAASGELNTTVPDTAAVIDRVAAAYPDAKQDRLDGLTVDLGEWWFNLRPSNTEPLLRLNLEAPDDEAVARRVAEVQAIIPRTVTDSDYDLGNGRYDIFLAQLGVHAQWRFGGAKTPASGNDD